MKTKELLEYLLKEIQYIRTHTDEISVLAGLNIMEQKINDYIDLLNKIPELEEAEND